MSNNIVDETGLIRPIEQDLLIVEKAFQCSSGAGNLSGSHIPLRIATRIKQSNNGLSVSATNSSMIGDV